MKTDRMILGKNAVYSTDSSLTGLNNNVIVCGPSGCGKTMSIQETDLLEASESSRIVLISKRRIVDRYRDNLLHLGFDVQVLDFTNPGVSTCGWNLLRGVRSFTDIRSLAEAIVMANPRKEHSNADPYWDEGSISLLTALISLALILNKKASFNDVLTYFDQLRIYDGSGEISTNLDDSFTNLERADPKSYALVCWNSFKGLPYKTASCIYSTLSVCLTSLFTPDVRKLIARKNAVSAETITSKKTVLFVITSPVNPVLRLLINIFHEQMIRDLFEYAEKKADGKLPIPVRYQFDDFACGGRILNFPEYISIFREKLISAILMIQSESQLVSMYGHDDAVTIINNCDTYVYMGGMDLQTCRNVSERINAPLDEVLYMPVGQEMIFRRGQRPVVTQRYDILSDERYRKIKDDFEQREGVKTA